MTTFRYRARTAAGDAVHGAFVAPDPGAVVASLRTRALFVTAVEPERGWTLRVPAWGRARSSARARAAFFRCLATLIGAGVPLRRALGVTIERCTERGLRDALEAVLGEVERGGTLSAAFGRRPAIFPALVVAMIAAGETGGMLDDVLERVATLLERDHDLHRRVLAALAYPATVSAAALALVAFLIVRVLPMFSDLFHSFHVELPATTRLLLAVGAAFDRPPAWIASGILLAAVPAALWRLRRSREGRRLLDRIRLRIPLVGGLARAAIAARLARMLGTLVHAGVGLNAALEAIAPVAGSELHADALGAIAIAIREGEALTPPLAAAGLFDSMLVVLVGVGEETGMLDALLIKAADYFEADVAATIATLGSVVEPLLIVFLGAIVGLIVSSVFVPLYALIGGFSQ